MPTTKIDQALELVPGEGVLRPRDLAPHHISRQTLKQLCDRGDVRRVGRGLYVLADFSEVTQHHSLAQASKRIPKGVVCLISALSFHELTTQNPSQVWMAIGTKTWQPDIGSSLVHTVRFSGASLEYGIEDHVIEGVTVRIYDPAKTVADCFKYRNKIGLEVALEALRDCWRQKKATIDQDHGSCRSLPCWQGHATVSGVAGMRSQGDDVSAQIRKQLSQRSKTPAKALLS